MKNQLFGALCLLGMLWMACEAPQAGGDAAADTAADTMPPPPAEFADAKYADMAKASMEAFARKDIATWIAGFSDDARFQWNSGDSLVGKQAINDFWTNRMTEVIDSITFSDNIYLPVKVNEPQSVEAAGVWVLSWHNTMAKYKATGKKMYQWVHFDLHFNANDKIDQAIVYLDRLSIQQASN